MYGSRIRDLRKNYGYTQGTLAEKLSVSEKTIGAWEREDRTPPLDKLLTLSKMFNVTTDYILGSQSKNERPDNIYPTSNTEFVNIPVIGTIKAGMGGLAFEDYQGISSTSKSDIKSGEEYFWLIVSGDSMLGDGIYDGDYALIQRTPLFDNGDICAVIVDEEEGTLKHVTRSDNSIILTASNPKYQPRIFSGRDMSELIIAGRLVETKRKY